MGAKRASRKTKSPRVFGHPPRRAKTAFRVGLYARVSTQDQQTIPMQTRALREYAARRGWTITLQVKEIGSGASQRERREKLLDAARRREIDVVLVWRLDRWGRSVTDLLASLQELEHLGVGFVSLTEALDLTTPAGRAMAAFWPFSRSSNGRFSGNESAPGWRMPARTANVWGDPLRQVSMLIRSGSSTARARVNPKSPAGCKSAVPPCAAFCKSIGDTVSMPKANLRILQSQLGPFHQAKCSVCGEHFYIGQESRAVKADMLKQFDAHLHTSHRKQWDAQQRKKVKRAKVDEPTPSAIQKSAKD